MEAFHPPISPHPGGFFCYGNVTHFLNRRMGMGVDWIFCNILLVCLSLIRVATGCFSRVFKSTLQKWERRGQIFQKRATRARRARTPQSVLSGMYKKKPKKSPKIEKNAFFGPKNHPLKVSNSTMTGVFFPPPVECFRSETSSSL